MATGEPQTFRIPLVLLAATNLALLGAVLWPWQEALNLPVGGTTAFDPAISLLAYMGIIFWIGSGIEETTQKALSSGAIMGLAAAWFLWCASCLAFEWKRRLAICSLVSWARLWFFGALLDYAVRRQPGMRESARFPECGVRW
jgi:hypothetical protein